MGAEFFLKEISSKNREEISTPLKSEVPIREAKGMGVKTEISIINPARI